MRAQLVGDLAQGALRGADEVLDLTACGGSWARNRRVSLPVRARYHSRPRAGATAHGD